MLVPVLDEIVLEGAKNGVEDVMIGMAHRGRLSVLAHVLENYIATCLLSSNMQK